MRLAREACSPAEPIACHAKRERSEGSGVLSITDKFVGMAFDEHLSADISTDKRMGARHIRFAKQSVDRF